jgi:hypothetical protein
VQEGYIKSDFDVCVYTKTVDGSLVIVGTYVDDGLIVAKTKDIIAKEFESLHRVYTLKVLGPISNFLSIEVAHFPAGLLILRPRAVRHLHCISRSSIDSDGKPSRRRLTPPFEDIVLYQSAVGALMFTATYVRADLAVAVRAAA